jgi:ABC-type amino acid transport system permease subunit
MDCHIKSAADLPERKKTIEPMMRKSLLLALFSLLAFSSFAQEEGVAMADAMRNDGKIYLVVAVIVTIFAGIIIYLIRLDRKISKLEKTIHS